MSAAAGRPIRLGMVGGGQGAFIGAVHRMAARLDGRYELCAGALSSDPGRARASAAEIGLADDRSYATYVDMIAGETQRADPIEAVAIVTPNHLHFPIAKAFLEAGFHVICDKPLTVSVDEARALCAIAESQGLVLAVTYNYSGYPMIRQARAMIARGDLGELRVVHGEYVQQWLAQDIEKTGQKQAAWRTDPGQSGAGGCIGDIGTHIYHLIEFVTGLETQALCADLTAFVPQRRLDDNSHLLLRFRGGAKGMLWASQVAPGHENGLELRVYGDRGGLVWRQETPNELIYAPLGEEPRRITRGGFGALDVAARLTRLPSGHPEGYIEGFANIYGEIAAALMAARAGKPVDAAVTFPTGADGERGVAFVEAAVRSSNAGAVWVDL
ncbi:MAG TPA: Gfo/Idh/MocA family oxidoreductase [Woeseiaceae bacterium]